MGMISEFKDFAMKGNVVDMAVGIIIGGAFGAVVTSFIDNIVMPAVAAGLGKPNFDQVGLIELSTTTNDAGETIANNMALGAFATTVINFLILAFSIFMVIKAMNKMKKAEEEAPSAPPAEEVLLGEIRDLLAKR